MSILRNMAHAVRVTVADARVRNIFTAKVNLATLDRHQPRKRIHQLALPVAVDAGNAHDLSPANRKGNIMHRIFLMYLAPNGEPPHIQDYLAGGCRRFIDRKLYIPPHHHVGELLFGGVRDVDRTDALPLAEYRTAVGYRHNLVEFVGDKQNGFSLSCKPAHDMHQFVNFLRGQHCRRLIENQDLIVAVKHFQDFRPLLHPDCDIFDLGIQIHVETVLLGKFGNALSCLFGGQETGFTGFCPKNDVVKYGKHLNQFEMLMHHADAERRRIVRGTDIHAFSVFIDLSLLRLIKPEEYAHQRRLTCPVLSEEGMDLTALQL